MKLVILSYNESGDLIREVKDGNQKINSLEFRQIKIDKEGKLIKLSLSVNDADDIEEYINILQTQPKKSKQLLLIKDNAEFYKTDLEDSLIRPVVDKVIEDLKSMR